MGNLGGHSFIPINLGHVDEEMIRQGRGVSHVVLQQVFEVMTRSRLACLTATLHGILDVLKNSSCQSSDKWNETENFFNTNPDGSYYLRSICLNSRMNSYSNGKLPTC
ncbi:hypothetical protein TNCV_2839161 [Trichonephila clavipes]|nr:hypothetical protein TNCV_2839161 [Trichonephila clavipes]